SADVLLDAFRRGLHHVRHVLELVAALAHAGRAAEVVECPGREAALGKSKRELLVEAVETPDVRHYDDADVARLVRRGRERGEAVSVGGVEHEVAVGDGGSRDRRNRRRRVEVEAHGPTLTTDRLRGDRDPGRSS